MAILAGERDDNQTTLEVQYDLRENLDKIMLRRWSQTEHGLMDLQVMGIPLSEDLDARIRLVRDFAKVLGVPVDLL